MEYNGTLTNILQGVSQQARIDRRPEQLEEQVNCLSDIADGFIPRPGSTILTSYSQDDYTENTAYHEYDRGDSQERYSIYFPRDEEVMVRDLFTGSEVAVSTNGNEGYLACSNPAEDIRCYTIADTTFILNRDKVPAIGNTSDSDEPWEILLYASRASWGMTYTVYYGNTVIAQCDTPDIVQLDLSTPSASESSKALTLEPSELIQCLWTGATVGNFTWLAGYPGGLTAYCTANSMTASRKEDIVYIKGPASSVSSLVPSSETVNKTATNETDGINAATLAHTLPSDTRLVTATVTSYGHMIGGLLKYGIYVKARFKYYTGGKWKYGEWSDKKAVSWDTSNTLPISTPVEPQDITKIVVEIQRVEPDLTTSASWSPTDPLFSIQVAISTATVYAYSGLTSSIKFNVFDNMNGTDLRIIGGKFTSYTDLPRTARHDFKVKITGEDERKANDYYVKFQGDYDSAGFQQGTWVECVGFNVNQTIDPETMPHILTRQPDGTFSLDQVEWDDRTAGDDDSNPEPSFINKEITEIIHYQGRLVLLSEENAVASCTFEPYNFFAPSVLQSADTDPIDTSVADNQVSNLYNAIIFNSSLVLFSDRAQFIHPSDRVFSSETFSLQSAMQYKNQKNCRPVVSASSVFFAFNSGEFTGIREILINPTSGAFLVNDITKHIDHYITGTPVQLAASSDYDVLFVRAEDDPDRIYVYQWYTADGERKQAAWHYWEFDGDIVNMSILQNTLYIWILRNDNVFIEEISMANVDTTGCPFNVRLDSKIIKEATDGTDYWLVDVSELTDDAGYSYDDITVVAGENTGIAGNLVPWEEHTTDTIKILKEAVFPGTGETPNFVIGIAYNSYGVLTNPYVRDQFGTPKTKGRLRLGNMSFNVSDTSDLSIEVSKDNAPTYTKVFTSAIIDESSFILDEPRPLLDASIPVTIRSDADRCSIKFQSFKHTPFSITSIDWTGSYYETGRRTR